MTKDPPDFFLYIADRLIGLIFFQSISRMPAKFHQGWVMRHLKLFVAICLLSFVGLMGSESMSPDYREQMREFIRSNQLEKVQFLIELSHLEIDEPIDDYSHNTPLMEAAKNGRLAIMEYLIDAGADIFVSNSYKSTVLNEVIRNDSLSQNKTIKMARFLISLGADVNTPGSDGKTALMYAFDGKRLNLVRDLIDLGANVKARSNNGCTTLMYAADAENIDAMKMLMDMGVDIYALNKLGSNTFTWTIRNGKTKAFNYLVKELNIDINLQDYLGLTPLMWAVFYHQVNIVQILIDSGAEINARTTKPIQVNVSTDLLWSINPKYETLPIGSTALTFAKKYGLPSIAQILEQAGGME